MCPGSITNRLQPTFNFAAHKSTEVDVVARQRAFRKQHRVAVSTRRLENEPANEFDIFREGPAILHLRRCDSENVRHQSPIRNSSAEDCQYNTTCSKRVRSPLSIDVN